MRKTRRSRKKKQKKVVIISSLCLLIVMTIGYAAFSTNLNITAKGNVKEKSRVIQSWDENSQTDFHSTFYKKNILNITFLDNANIPSNATESWNVSEDKTHGGVMAWVILNNEDNTKYDLYIGAKDGVIANKNSSNLFKTFSAIKTINFDNNFDTSNVTNMQSMFTDCRNLEELDLSRFDTSNVTTMHTMFYYCENLKKLNISNFNTSKVINMRAMFGYCANLNILNLSSFDTSAVIDMSYMFEHCNSLTTLDLSNFNTSKVTTMYGMFSYFQSPNIEEINLCNFDTSSVVNMNYMFQYTTKLKKISVGSNWTETNADVTNMFTGSGVSSVTTGEC